MATLVYSHDYLTEDDEHYSMLEKIENWFRVYCADSFANRFQCGDELLTEFKKDHGERLELNNGRTELPYLGMMWGNGIKVWDTQREVYELNEMGAASDWSRTWYDLILEFPTDEDAVLFKLTL